MASRNEAWGIDVGSYAVKAVRLVQESGGLRLADFEVLKYKQVLSAPDVDAEEAVQVQLSDLAQRYDLAKSTIIASVPGSMALAKFANLPPVDPKKIPDIVRFEAQQQIPFPLDEVEWDYQVTQEEDMPDVRVSIFAIQKARVMDFLSGFRLVGTRVDELTMSPVAVQNAFQFEAGGEVDQCTVYLDIGCATTDVIIVDGNILWLRTFPVGGNTFTEALVSQFKISFAKAEKLKKEAATSKYAKQIFQAMRAVFADLVQEVQKSIGYFQSQHRGSVPVKLIGLGSTFKLPGLQKFLKQQLQLEVEKAPVFERISVAGKREAELAEHAGELATAYGLALQGLDREKVSANLMPEHILNQRMWRAKQPWIGAAAALVAMGSGLYGLKYFLDRAAFEEAQAESQRITRPVLAQARDLETEAQERMTDDPSAKIANLTNLIDRRGIYASILADLDAALRSVDPQPAIAEGDFDGIRAIPRRERRLVQIDRVDLAYDPVAPIVEAGDPEQAAAEAAGDYGSGQGLPPGQTGSAEAYNNYVNANQGGGGTYNARRSATRTPRGVASAAGLEEQARDTRAFFTETAAPTIEVRITGRTPYSPAPTLLTQTLLRWLQDHAQRPDAPYDIVVVPEDAIVRSDALVAAGGSGSQRPTASLRSLSRRPPSGAGQLGDDIAAVGDISLEAMLPRSPLADEEIAGDTEFEIRFALRLKDPQAAAEAPAEPAVDPPNDTAARQPGTAEAADSTGRRSTSPSTSTS